MIPRPNGVRALSSKTSQQQLLVGLVGTSRIVVVKLLVIVRSHPSARVLDLCLLILAAIPAAATAWVEAPSSLAHPSSYRAQWNLGTRGRRCGGATYRVDVVRHFESGYFRLSVGEIRFLRCGSGFHWLSENEAGILPN